MTGYAPSLSPVFLIDLALLTMLMLVAIAMLRSRHLFAVVMLSGIYSLLSAAFSFRSMRSTSPLQKRRWARAFQRF